MRQLIEEDLMNLKRDLIYAVNPFSKVLTICHLAALYQQQIKK